MKESSSIGRLVAGTITGLFVGVLAAFVPYMPVAVVAAAHHLDEIGTYRIVAYAIACGVGIGAFIAIARRVNFRSGFLIGIAVGMLGGTTVCSQMRW